MEYIAGHQVEFDEGLCLFRLTFKGAVTSENLRAMADEIYDHPRYDPEWDILIDMGTATFDLNYARLLDYVNYVSKHPRRVRGATAIVSRSILHFGIGRMYDGIAGDSLGALRIERTPEACLAWLAQRRAPVLNV